MLTRARDIVMLGRDTLERIWWRIEDVVWCTQTAATKI
jgi:hypothetical protein